MSRQPTSGIPRTPAIDRLVMVVTDSCNLSCHYCYARLSPNAPVAHRMSPNTARQIIRRFLSGRDRCELVQFFGGEPTLNLDAVEAAIEETYELVASGSLRERPRFAVVTNGVLKSPERYLDLVTRYGVETTVSLDGPAYLHDQLRPYKNGAPSYDQAVHTISALLQARVAVAIETVYTARHVQAGFSVGDSLDYSESLGVNRVIFDIAYPPAPPELNPLLDPYFQDTLAYHRAAVDKWFGRLLVGQQVPSVYFRDLLLPLLDGVSAVPPIGRCGAGEADFAVGPNGDLYGCQLLYGNPIYRIGNVSSDVYPGISKSLPIGTNDFADCTGCAARHWCQPCAALNDAYGDISRPPERVCALRRAVVLQIGRWAFGRLAVPCNEVTSRLRYEVGVDGCLD